MPNKSLMIIALAAAITAPGAFAQTTAFADPVYAGNQSWIGNLGNDFIANQPITVTSLGVFHANTPNPFVGTIVVGIFNSSGTLVAGPVSFSSATQGTVSGGDNFLPITPVILPAGTYSVVAYFDGVDENGNSNLGGYMAATTNTGGGLISFPGTGRYDGNASLDYPTFGTGSYVFNAGTFMFTTLNPPTLTKAFGAVAMGAGGVTAVTFTVTNPNTSPLSGIMFTDTLPTGLVVATPNGVTGSCGGGTVTATAGTNSIALAGGTLAGSASCTFAVNVAADGTAFGEVTNTTSGPSAAQTQVGLPASATIFIGNPYQITYAANLGVGDSIVNISNTGSNGAGLTGGTTASVTGAICANVYVFTPDEEIVACCSCPVTPDGLVSLSAQMDLISNTFTQKTAPTSIVIKLLATQPVGGSCAQSAAAVGGPGATLVNGIATWGTKLHANSSPTGGYNVTETQFTNGTLTSGELSRLAYNCGIVLNQGSGNGVCASCRLGGLGAVKQ